MAEDSEARWAWLDRSEYSEDPETKQTILWERWDAAEDDPCRRQEIARRSARWLLDELRECVRLGRSCLVVAPRPDAVPLSTYRDQAELYRWRVDECLRRAVSTAGRCRGSLTMELGASVLVVDEIFSRVFSGSLDPEVVEHHVDLLTRASDVLAGAHRAESEPGEREPFSGAAGEPRKASQAPGPRPRTAPGKERSIDYADVALRLRRAGKPKQAALVELMADEDGVPADEVARIVHGDDQASEKTMRANADRTNESLEDMGIPLSFRLVSGLMFREISPE